MGTIILMNTNTNTTDFTVICVKKKKDYYYFYFYQSENSKAVSTIYRDHRGEIQIIPNIHVVIHFISQ